MAKEKHDDLETVRLISDALEPFSEDERERIIRWSREKLGMQLEGAEAPPSTPATNTPIGSSSGDNKPEQAPQNGADIRSFVERKSPKNDNQFCAVVAYYYKFEAPQNQRKEVISGEDIQDAARKANRDRFPRPSQTLNNAFAGGYLDKAEYGNYKLNTVGENLVAMVLPGGDGETRVRPKGKPKAPKKAIKRRVKR